MNRRTRKELLLIMLLLGGCASTPAPTPTGTPRTQSDALSDALGRVANRTTGAATSTGGNQAAGSVYQGLGGGVMGSTASAATRAVASELQRWWSTRP